MQSSLDHILSTYGTNDRVVPLPPLNDSALEPHQKESPTMTVHILHPDVPNVDKIEVLTILQRCGAVKIGDILIGSERGKHKPYSIVMAYPLQLDEPRLARIHYFAKCSYVLQSPNNCNTRSSWFAVVSFFQMHQCHV